MNKKLGIVVCNNFAEEVEFILKKNNIENVGIAYFHPQCTYSKIGQNDQLEVIKKCQETCNKIKLVVHAVQI